MVLVIGKNMRLCLYIPPTSLAKIQFSNTSLFSQWGLFNQSLLNIGLKAKMQTFYTISFWSYLKDFHVCVMMLFFYYIAVCFLVCWFPFFLCNTWSGIMMELNLPHLEPSMTLFLLTTWLGYINSILNPFIYTIYNREFRKAFRKLFKTVREEKKPKT